MDKHVKFPGEKKVLEDYFNRSGDSDEVLSRLSDSGLTGYLYISSDGQTGLVVFDKGDISAAYYLEQGKIVSTGVNALMEFRALCSKGCTVSVSEVPDEFTQFIRILYVGNPVIPSTESRIIDLSKLYGTYREKVQTGLVILTGVDGRVGIIGIKKGKWSTVTDKEEFGSIFVAEGSRLYMYELSDLADDSQEDYKLSLKSYVTLGDRIKKLIVTSLNEKFGKSVINISDEISGKRVTIGSYQNELVKLSEYLKLFVDGNTAYPFIEELEDKIKKVVKAVTG